MVPVAEISDPKNDYNLNLPRYIDSTEPEDLQDIDGHLRGGIPERDIDALARYWQVIPGVRAALFKKADRPGYSQLSSPSPRSSPPSSATRSSPPSTPRPPSSSPMEDGQHPALKGFAKDGHPKALIETIAEDLLATFENAPLLDPYDVYQHLMDYWAETMQDDCYLIAGDGWREAAQPRLIVEDKNKEDEGEGPISTSARRKCSSSPS